MIFDIDAYRTARMLVRHYGTDARLIATAWAGRYIDNKGGHALWMKIIQTIAKLEANDRI